MRRSEIELVIVLHDHLSSAMWSSELRAVPTALCSRFDAGHEG